MIAQSVLVSMLNRLGGRTDSVAASRDLVTLAPAHLPIVCVADAAGRTTITALSVEELMTRHLGHELEVIELLHSIAREGSVRAPVVPGLEECFWTSRDPKDLARLVVQWAIDHPETGFGDEAFALARTVLDG